MNQRPPGYEPDELPTALPRDIYLLSLYIIAYAAAFVNTQIENILLRRVGVTMIVNRRPYI